MTRSGVVGSRRHLTASQAADSVEWQLRDRADLASTEASPAASAG